MTIIGIDEVGRGPLAGPVVACAAFFTNDIPSNILDDSKKLSPKKRQEILQQIQNKVKYEISVIWQDQIDEIREFYFRYYILHTKNFHKNLR